MRFVTSLVIVILALICHCTTTAQIKAFKGKNPLVVRDGIPTGRDYLDTLHPNDIAQITVLKDSAATALYGSSAKEGAVLITTIESVRQRNWRIFSALSADYATLVPSWEADENIQYFVNGKPILQHFQPELLDITEKNTSIKVIDQASLFSDYHIKEKSHGVIITTTSAKAQKANEGRLLTYPKLGWTITLPSGFDLVPEAEWSRLQGRGLEAMQETYADFDTSLMTAPEQVFVFRNGRQNYFEANLQGLAQEDKNDYPRMCQAINQMIVETFTSQMPGATIDTLSSTAIINGLAFYAFSMTTHYGNGLVLYATRYSRRFGDDDLTVSIMFVDKAIGQQLMQAWKGSVFAKRE